ncbi:hypothetical protein [Streptosporangium sp. H16]|uniref:hypothetical protein n=1 Tax=Streptosporangium sp. H16 TaxID=3444184 RepID=UPI003F7B008C
MERRDERPPLLNGVAGGGFLDGKTVRSRPFTGGLAGGAHRLADLPPGVAALAPSGGHHELTGDKVQFGGEPAGSGKPGQDRIIWESAGLGRPLAQEGVLVVIAENPTNLLLACSDVRAPQGWCAGRWIRRAGLRMPLTWPERFTPTMVSDIRWIFRDYYRDPFLHGGPEPGRSTPV